MARYGDAALDVRAYLCENEDARLTYHGYIKFLQKDLLHSSVSRGANDVPLSNKKLKAAAKGVVRAFAAAVKASFGGAVRLSVHPSLGKEKLSMSLVPQKSGRIGHTPWHSCVAVGIEGSFTTVRRADVAATHDLVRRNRRPYYYREKSDLYHWGERVPVKLENLYPTSLIVRPAAAAISLRDMPMLKVRALAQLQSPVVCRGFTDATDEALFQHKAHELGTVVPWTYSIMEKVKDARRRTKDANIVASNEAMAMHYDGTFKFVATSTTNAASNEVRVQCPPKFQFFTAIATAPRGTGFTLFASSARFFQHLPPPYTRRRLERATWRLVSDGYWRAKLEGMPLVVRHPATGMPCVRWHEPWPAARTSYSACNVLMENDEQALVLLVSELLRDRRVYLNFTWEQGDVLVNNNVAMLHTRTAFSNDCDREL
jgi:alpha-ketoglutarate-dependent taurine dioxygenase